MCCPISRGCAGTSSSFSSSENSPFFGVETSKLLAAPVSMKNTALLVEFSPGGSSSHSGWLRKNMFVERPVLAGEVEAVEEEGGREVRGLGARRR